jgi:hypothetical protein
MGAVTIGWAARDITPSRIIALRGQFNLRIATRVQDPLTLTALAIESDGEQVVFVSVDNASIDPEVTQGSRALLAERLPELDPRKLVMGATHTHTAPFGGTNVGLQKDEFYLDDLRQRYPDYMTAAEYSAFLTEALVSAVCEAWQSRQPGLVGWGYSYAVIGENRRVRFFDDRAVMYGNVKEPDFSHIEGHVDHGVHLLCTYGTDQQLTGMIVNVPCPSQATEGAQDFISADYWHDVRQEIRRRKGDGLFILPQCSAAGDQTPHRMINRAAEDRMMKLKYGEGLSNGRNFGLRQDLARRLADAVDDAEPVVRQDLRASITLKHQPRDLELQHWQVTDAEYATLQGQIADALARLEEIGETDRLSSEYTALRSRIAWCQRAVDRYEHPFETIATEFNVLRFGDVAFVTAPFEYYLDFGDRIKARSAAVQTFVVQLSGGGGGYLPTERAAAGLSYGAIPASCRVSPAGGQMLVDDAVATIGELFADV